MTAGRSSAERFDRGTRRAATLPPRSLPPRSRPPRRKRCWRGEADAHVTESFKAHFTPCVEIAWRLARDYWGFGYATEAGCARVTMASPTSGSSKSFRLPFQRTSVPET
jgi:hypothetical protein